LNRRQFLDAGKRVRLAHCHLLLHGIEELKRTEPVAFGISSRTLNDERILVRTSLFANHAPKGGVSKGQDVLPDGSRISPIWRLEGAAAFRRQGGRGASSEQCVWTNGR
jgi:hypothetical protein